MKFSLSAVRLLGILSVVSGIHAAGFGGVKHVLLEDFEGTQSAAPVALTTANSHAQSNASVTVVKQTDEGSNRLKLTKQSGTVGGFLLQFTDLALEPGNYLITADVKIADSAESPIASFGMGVVAGPPVASKISDLHGGYIMNLNPAGNNSALGYQTLGAAIQIPAATSTGQLTLYFSQNPTGNSHVPPRNNVVAPASDGRHANAHRTNALTWTGASAPNNAVYIDNIKLIGPGNIGENRHYWPSAGNSLNHLARQSAYIDVAKDNGFNVIDFLARFRTNAFYVPNRDFNTFPNSEPFAVSNSISASRKNDALQFYIDRCREEGIKTYISYSCFGASENGTWPSVLPANAMNYVYNNGNPIPSASGTVYGDAGVPQLRQHLIRTMNDIIENYDIDGVIFDRIRLEGRNDGYNPMALAAYGYAPGVLPLPDDPQFVAHRQNAYTTFLREAYESATDLKPWLAVGTVPVVFGYDFGSTYNHVFQSYPQWNSVKTRNRAVSFGAHDVIQPQLYRGTQNNSTYRDFNGHYMDYMRFGDLGAYSLDFGMAPGAYVNLEPLFYHPTVPDQPMSVWNAENLYEAREKGMNGVGIYSADTTRIDMHFIRQAQAYGQPDQLAGRPPHADYLMKKDYDNTPPNSVKSLTGSSTQNLTVDLNWQTPDAAEDGDTATRYIIHRGTLPGVKKYYATQLFKNSTVTANNITDTVPAAGEYYYSVIAVDKYNNRSTPVEIGPITVSGPSTTAPAAPSALQNFVMGNRVYLKWEDNSTNERVFEIRRNAVLIGTVSENVYFFRCDDIPEGTWNFSVRAVNHTGGSSEISANVTAAAPLTPPTNVSLTGTQNSVQLAWNDSNTQQSGFEILRASTASGPWTQIATVGPFVNQFTDNDINETSAWFYALRTFNGVAYSVLSNTVVMANEVPSGDAPVLTGDLTGSIVSLQWTDNHPNEFGWYVYRRKGSGNFELVSTLPANSTSTTDIPPQRGEWNYKVVAFNSKGNGAESNLLPVSVPVPPDIIIESRLPDGSLTPAPTYKEAEGFGFGNTTAKSLAEGLKGTGSRYIATTGINSYAEFRPQIMDAGLYNVYVTSPNSVNGPNVHSPGCEYFIYGMDSLPRNGTFTFSSSNEDLADKWLLLEANVPMTAGTGGYIQLYNRNPNSSGNQRFNPDSVKFVYTGPLAGIDFNESILY